MFFYIYLWKSALLIYKIQFAVISFYDKMIWHLSTKLEVNLAPDFGEYIEQSAPADLGEKLVNQYA